MSTQTPKKTKKKIARQVAQQVAVAVEKPPTRSRKPNVVRQEISSGLGPAIQGTGPSKPQRSTMGMMREKLTQQDAGVAGYLMGLTTPTAPCRPPWVLGDFQLDTNTYSYVFSGVATCSSAGFGYVGAVPDGWSESGNDAGPAYQFCCATNAGKPFWYSPSGTTTTVTAPVGDVSGATHAGLDLPKLDPGFTTLSRYRLTALILTVWPDSPQQTTQGDLCVAFATSEEALEAGALNNVTWATIAGYPQEYVTHFELPLSNWDPAKASHAVAVPFSENCFTFNYMPTSGRTTAAGFLMVAVITGAASGQTMRFRAEYKYETTAPTSYQTGLTPILGMRNPVPKETLIPHLNALRPLAISHAPVEALPAKGMLAMKNADPSLFSRVVSGISSVAPTIAGLVKAGISRIPILQAAFSGLKSFFN